MELIYTAQQSGFEPNKYYRNPLYFERAENGVSKVIVHGDYPAVVQAYQAKGIEVVQADNKQNDYAKMTVDELKAKLTELGIEIPSDAKKADLLALLVQKQ